MDVPLVEACGGRGLGLGAGLDEGAPPPPSASGEGRLGEVRTVGVVVAGAPSTTVAATVDDRGVRGAMLNCGEMELPLAFASIRGWATEIIAPWRG